jgi:orotidine-5'-phosphate decarboxylase
VFLDLKWHDIPSTVAEAVSAARTLGVALATVHCLGARDAGGRRAAAGADLALVGVTLLTSHVPADVEQILGRGVPDLGFEAARLARLAVGAGLRGVVASGRDLAVLRSTLGAEPWIVVPGIRSPDAPPDDQARTVTPVEAVRPGRPTWSSDGRSRGRRIRRRRTGRFWRRYEAGSIGSGACVRGAAGGPVRPGGGGTAGPRDLVGA